ncbi:MAG: hypothetical protein AAF402_05385 [Pseudomonadota bacterium]
MALTAEEIDIEVCISGTTAGITLEGGQAREATWSGNSFPPTAFEAFPGDGEFFPDMTVAGRLISATQLEITVTVEGSGSTRFTIPFVAENCELIL